MRCVFFFQLIATLSAITCSRILCDRVFSKTSACQKLEASSTGDKLFLWVLYHRTTSGICIDEETLTWYRHCVSFHNISSVYAEINGRLKDQSREESCGTSSLRSVDYLFIIEQSCQSCGYYTDVMLSTIWSLIEYTKDREVFHDVRAQFGFIVYSCEEKLEYNYVRDFSTDFPSDINSHLVSIGSNCSASSLDSKYRSIESSIVLINRSLKLINRENRFHQRIRLSNNRSFYIWHRPYSDLHVLFMPNPCRINNGIREDLKSKVEAMKISIQQKITKLSQKVVLFSSCPLTLHVFLNTSDLDSVSVLGDPSLSVRYPDCSHFRKAATLKALISKGQGNTLQALLLSKGIEFQVLPLKDFEKVECIMSISPTLSTPQSIQPSFLNWCLLGREGNGDYCENIFCSALHGWTRKEARDLDSAPFQDKIPLTGKFGSSHDEIAKSFIHNVYQTQVQEELSITKNMDHHCVNFKPVITGQVKKLNWSESKPFIKELLAGGEPRVLRNTIVQTWSALKKWNMSYLSQNMEKNILKSVKSTNNFLTFDPDHNAPMKLNISLPYILINMSTTHFFECIQSTLCSDGKLGHYYFGTVPTSLKKDVSPNTFLYNTKKDVESSKQFMWISSPGMITHTHFDQDYNIFVQLLGKKRFTLWSPTQHELMYVFPRVHPMWHKSRVNYRAVDTLQFPGFTRAKGVQVELGPGDLLYIPPYTWHYVETLSPSVSLSTWSHDYDLYDHMNAIYKHDHKFDLLQSQRGRCTCHSPAEYLVISYNTSHRSDLIFHNPIAQNFINNHSYYLNPL